MLFRSLKLAPGSRNFLREIVIVVIGVLIALILQELVSNWREQRRAADIRRSMHTEIADFTEILSLRLRTQACITAKLDALDSILSKGGAVGPWQNVGRPSYFFSSQSAWNSTASDLLSGHIDPETFRSYGELYQGITQYGARGQLEQDHWVVLRSLERQDVPIGGERRWRLLEAVAGARNEALILNAVATQMTALAAGLGIKPNGALSAVKPATLPICQPLRKGPTLDKNA